MLRVLHVALRRPVARRLLSTPAAPDGVRTAVLRIADQQASNAPADLDTDLPTKFEVRCDGKRTRPCVHTRSSSL